jgi:hypothetical protein
MGGIFSFCYPHKIELGKPLTIIKNDGIKNYNDAFITKTEYDNETCANYLIGYPHEVTISNTNFTKYINGMYVYHTEFRTVFSLYEAGAGSNNEKCDIINDIRMANNNKNVKMFIQIMDNFEFLTRTYRTYLPENFEFKYLYAEKYLSLRFVFVSKEAMSHDIQILSTKFLAGPKKFKDCVSDLESREVLANYILKIPKQCNEISSNELYQSIFPNSFEKKII